MAKFGRELKGRWWMTLRQEILERDVVCQIKGARCSGVATEVDHIIPRKEFADGDVRMHEPRNLRGVCHTCHNERRKPAARRTWFD